LGGKNPFIVLDDANIEAAVEGAIWGTFFNSGQICSAASRYYVHEKIHDEFVEKFVAATSKLVMGDPMDFATGIGPLASQEQMKKVEGYIKTGQKEGAKLAYQGKKPDKSPFNKGYFVSPTIFTGVTQNMIIAREEIFGPVAPIIKFSDKDDVVELANDNNYGLSASVWTKNAFKAIKFANELQAGFVWINDHAYNTAEMPWGGFKASGIGKDNSVHAFDEFSQLKTVFIDISEQTRRLQYVLVNP
jgi:acyl-CoA reductase-like NAD-dependent aldehyde dehydrogenase